MSSSGDGLAQRVAELERELARREAELAIVEEVDDALEVALRRQWSVGQTMELILSMAQARMSALGVLVRTVDEAQAPVDFVVPDGGWLDGLSVDALCAVIEREGSVRQRRGEQVVLGYRLDMDDAYLGSVILAAHSDLEDEELDARARLLELWGEQVDNYLAALIESRRKHRALQALSDALRKPILDEGIDAALDVLDQHVAFEDLVLVLRYEERLDQHTVNYRVRTASGTLSANQPEDGPADLLHDEIVRFLEGDDSALVMRLGLSRHREAATIRAANGQTVVGFVSLGVRAEEGLSPFGRDVLDRLADYIRHRVVDFSKEWKNLTEHFSQPTVRRLLHERDYARRFLTPREADVAVMFCDISGFTRMSEQHLKEPALIAKLIDRWGARAVDFIWESGGVFDKMVGDCIIGLWGPPFFERDARQRCLAAIRAAESIRAYTHELMRDEDFPQLQDMSPPIGVATGINLCPLFVGMFGPGESFTGFSSGMNNTARLQGVAVRDEILCMERVCDLVGEAYGWGEARQQEVKNVEQPLRFRALR